MARALTVFLVTVIAAAGAGGFGALITRAVYVPILVPMALGAAVGVAVGFMNHLCGFKRGLVVVMSVLLGWVACVLAFHYVEYSDGFVNAVRLAHEETGSIAGAISLTDEQARAAADTLLVEQVGVGGFYGFLKLRAVAGIRMRGFGPGLLSRNWAFAMWLIDLLVMVVLIWRIGAGAAARP